MIMLRLRQVILTVLCAWSFSAQCTTTAFSILLMAKRGKGGLKRALDDRDVQENPKSSRSFNQGKGQEITGVTLPAEGDIKGWEFGDDVRLVCANVGGKFYGLQGECPRCAFDLWKGDLVVNDPGFERDCLACPTCATTYDVLTGKAGPPLKRKGIAAFVENLAKTATATEAERDAKAFQITRDEETGRVFLRERK